MKARLPIARGVFLTHGEDPAQLGLAARLNGIVPAERIFRPSLDDIYELTGSEPVLVESAAPRRLAAAQIASVDWNNDLASLVLDLNEEIRKAADEKTRQKIIRRLRRALEEA
jgi:metallo-beta-lactamase family protein